MAGKAFRKAGSELVYIKARWSGPEGVIENDKEFIVDTGAEESTCKPSNTRGKGLTFVGFRGASGVGGSTVTPAWDGGTATFDTQSPDGEVKTIQCQTVITESDFNLLGQDQLRSNKISVFNGDPPALVTGFQPR